MILECICVHLGAFADDDLALVIESFRASELQGFRAESNGQLASNGEVEEYMRAIDRVQLTLNA
jgi:hypothetical protein